MLGNVCLLFLAVLQFEFLASSREQKDINEASARIFQRALSISRSPPSYEYKKVANNVRCDGPNLKREFVNFAKCKELCTNDPDCRFFAVWSKPKKCETYDNCFSMSADGDRTILLYQKMRECDVEIGVDGQGRFIMGIQNAFSSNLVRSKGPHQNLYCKCISSLIMMCAIFTYPGASDDLNVRGRLDRSDLNTLQPFYVLPSFAEPDFDPIYYDPSGGMGDERVHAEVEVVSYTHCVSMSVCGDTNVCPVTGKPFTPGDPVFIWRDDDAKAQDGKTVPCISVAGIRVISRVGSGGFKDPHGRLPDQLCLTKKNYSLFFIFNNVQLAEGICNIPPGAGQSASKAGPSMSRVKGVQRSQPSRNPQSENIDTAAVDSHHVSRRGRVAASWRSHSPSEDGSLTTLSDTQQISRDEEEVVVPSTQVPTSAPYTSKAPSKYPSKQATASSSQAFDLSNDVLLTPLEVGSQMMLAGIPGEPGVAGTIVVVIQNLPDGRVSVQTGPREYIKTKRENLVGKQELAHLLDSSLPAPEGDETAYPNIGDQMMLRGLVKQPELNGKVGVVQKVLYDRRRVVMRIHDTEYITVKPQNLLPRGALGRYLRSHVATGQPFRPPESVTSPTVTTISSQILFTAVLFFIIFFTCFISFLQFSHSADDSFYIEFEKDSF